MLIPIEIRCESTIGSQLLLKDFLFKPLAKTHLNITYYQAYQQRSLTWLNVDVGAAQQVTASGGTT